jgi:hypothetical protein
MYTAHTRYGPVGYSFNAADYCNSEPCVLKALGTRLMPQDQGAWYEDRIESALHRVAAKKGIAWDEETTYDSGVFPKIIPYHNDLHADCGSETNGDGEAHCNARCAGCGAVIDGPCPALKEEE